MEARFEQFIRERKYLVNVTPATIEWYKNGFKWLQTSSPTQDDLKEAVMRMRAKGLRPTSCNSAIQALNTYSHWLHAGPDSKCGSGCKHPKVAHLKVPELLPPTFTALEVRRLVTWKPKDKFERRLHLLILLLFDTGCRISEALKLHVGDIDLENLLVKLDGKGRKQRVIPFSFELRKALHRYITEYNRKPNSLVFVASGEVALLRRNVLRDVKELCRSLGFSPPARTLHAMRHTFATEYLRRGGNVFSLQRVMGHSDLETTKRYAHMSTMDLQAVHERVSLLSP